MAGIDDQIREAQERVVRMTLARNAVRAKIVDAQVAPPTEASADAHAARARRQYDTVRVGLRHALDRLAALTAQSRAERR